MGLDLRGVFAAVLEPVEAKLEVGSLGVSWGAGVWEILPNLSFSFGVFVVADEGVGEGSGLTAELLNLSLRGGRADILKRVI